MYDNQYNLDTASGYSTFGFCPCKNNGCTNGCTALGASCMRSCSTSCSLSCSSQCTWALVFQLLN